MRPVLPPIDLVIHRFDQTLRVLAGVAAASRPSPANKLSETILSEQERRHSAGLMRVNHVGEVCAQALYQSQGMFAVSSNLQAQFKQAGIEEEDHLAWTAERLQELNSHTSLLNPLCFCLRRDCGARRRRAKFGVCG